MLFDPAEEQFHLPASSIQPGDGNSGEKEFVGEKNEPQISFPIVVVDAAQRSRIAEGSFRTGEYDGLVRFHSCRFIDGVRLTTVVLGALLATGDEESASFGKEVKTGKV